MLSRWKVRCCLLWSLWVGVSVAQTIDFVWATAYAPKVQLQAPYCRFYPESGRAFFPPSHSGYALALDLRRNTALGYIPLAGPQEVFQAGGWINDSIVYVKSVSPSYGIAVKFYNVLQGYFLDSIFLENSFAKLYHSEAYSYIAVHRRLRLVLEAPQYFQTVGDTLDVWSLETGKYRYGIPLPFSQCVIGLREDSDELVIAGDYGFYVYDLKDGRRIDRVTWPNASTNLPVSPVVSMTQGAKKIIAANILWDRENRVYQELEGVWGALSPDGRYLIIGGPEVQGGTRYVVRRVDLQTNQRKELISPGPINVLVSSVTGDTAYGYSTGKAFYVYDFRSNRVMTRSLWNFAVPAVGDSVFCELSPRGRYCRLQRSGQMIIFDVQQGKRIFHTGIAAFKPYEAWVAQYPYAVAFSWDERYIAFAGYPQSTQVTIFSLPDMQIVAQFQGDTAMTAVAFDPIHASIATGEGDGIIRVRSFSGAVIDSFGRNIHDPAPVPPEMPDVIWFLRYCKEGKHLIGMDESAAYYRRLWSLDVESRKFTVLQHPWGSYPLLDLGKFNGYCLADVRWGNTVYIAFCTGETQRYAVSPEVKRMLTNAVSGDGRLVAGIADDSTVVVIDLQSQQIVASRRVFLYTSGGIAPDLHSPNFYDLFWSAYEDKLAGVVVVRGFAGLSTMFLLRIPRFLTSVVMPDQQECCGEVKQSKDPVVAADWVAVYNLYGQLVYQLALENSRMTVLQVRKILRHKLPYGVYIVSWRANEGWVESRSIVLTP